MNMQKFQNLPSLTMTKNLQLRSNGLQKQISKANRQSFRIKGADEANYFCDYYDESIKTLINIIYFSCDSFDQFENSATQRKALGERRPPPSSS